MDRRSILIVAGVLLAGFALGVLVMLVLPDRSEPPVVYVTPDEPVAPAPIEPTAAGSTVQIGAQDPPAPGPLPELIALNQLFRGVASRVTPTVVFLEVEMPTDARGREFDDAQPFMQPRRFRRSAGSGVIISDRGFVVTNAHVIGGASRIRVLLNDKREYEAEVIGIDATTDLAVIRLPRAENLPVISLGDSDELEVGEWVLAIGNPFRLTSTVTAGIVSALGRQVDIIDDAFRIEDFIQTDAAINPGNSGGALVNLSGQLVGIATAIATEGGAYEGYGFAVPARLMTRVVTDLIEFGEVQRGYLGVQIQAVTALDAQRHGLERIGGVVVEEVAEAGAAALAGIRTGDILLAIDGREVDAPNQFQSVIAMRRPGDNVRLTIWRRGTVREVDARLIGRDDASFRAWAAQTGVRPAPPRELPRPDPFDQDLELHEPEHWGVGLRDLTAGDRERFGVENGAFVTYVRPGGLAGVDGLPSHTVIVEIEGQPITSASEAGMALERAAARGNPALVRIMRPDGLTAYYDLQPPQAGQEG
jgi:serine protease Do